MIRQSILITMEKGIHMKTSLALTNAIRKSESEVWIETNHRKVNAKSIMMLLAASIQYKDTIDIICDGPDEEATMKLVLAVLE